MWFHVTFNTSYVTYTRAYILKIHNSYTYCTKSTLGFVRLSIQLLLVPSNCFTEGVPMIFYCFGWLSASVIKKKSTPRCPSDACLALCLEKIRIFLAVVHQLTQSLCSINLMGTSLLRGKKKHYFCIKHPQNFIREGQWENICSYKLFRSLNIPLIKCT